MHDINSKLWFWFKCLMGCTSSTWEACQLRLIKAWGLPPSTHLQFLVTKVLWPVLRTVNFQLFLILLLSYLTVWSVDSDYGLTGRGISVSVHSRRARACHSAFFSSAYPGLQTGVNYLLALHWIVKLGRLSLIYQHSTLYKYQYCYCRRME